MRGFRLHRRSILQNALLLLRSALLPSKAGTHLRPPWILFVLGPGFVKKWHQLNPHQKAQQFAGNNLLLAYGHRQFLNLAGEIEYKPGFPQQIYPQIWHLNLVPCAVYLHRLWSLRSPLLCLCLDHFVLPSSPAAAKEHTALEDEMDVNSSKENPGLRRQKRKNVADVSKEVNVAEGPSIKKARTVSKPAAQTKQSRKASGVTGSSTTRGVKPNPRLNAKGSESVPVDSASKSNAGGSKKRGETEAGTAEGGTDVCTDIPAVPPNAPKYVENILALCLWVEGHERWQRVVQAWFQFNQAATFQPSSKTLLRLSTSGRPKEVGTWISYARSATFCPEVSLPLFGDQFSGWWRGMQPEGRDAVEGEFIGMTRGGEVDWTQLKISGQNGMVNVLAALSWWHKTVHDLPKENALKTGRSGQKRTMELRKLNEALDEVAYVLEQLIK